ncbi:hypothetical protein D5086_007801 [Populus alba]|uniref:Uncharacterized protein n=1 Tax=Populus alba TaxID=43335 RepID=A0ACC4CDW1_POPAL
MAPETRTAEIKRLEDSIESAKREANTKYDQLVNLMQDQGEASHNRDKHSAYQLEPSFRPSYATEGRQSHYKVHRPKHLFPVFEGEDVHRWLYKCNQYFEIEDIEESDKLKLASYYLDGIALYWHQNFMRNINNQRVSWGEYVEALCYRFGGQKDPMEDLIDLKQVGTLETYIHDFDVLWNKAGIGEKQALVIF